MADVQSTDPFYYRHGATLDSLVPYATKPLYHFGTNINVQGWPFTDLSFYSLRTSLYIFSTHPLVPRLTVLRPQYIIL
jgi:hypothetical protein